MRTDRSEQQKTLQGIPVDLVVPKMTRDQPGPGRRVRQTWPEYQGTSIHHALYLPTDWRPGAKFPVIVEYAGNRYRNANGDVSSGRVEGGNLGYGISGGKGFVWLCLPFVDTAGKKNATEWWGDVDATVQYCLMSVAGVCAQFGGRRSAVFLAGFSRGAIACNYIGLHNNEISKLWVGFIAHDHYDGVCENWPYPGADRASALRRLKRLKNRPVFISQERTTLATREYLHQTGLRLSATFVDLPYCNHTDTWVLRSLPERKRLRGWVRKVLAGEPILKQQGAL